MVDIYTFIRRHIPLILVVRDSKAFEALKAEKTDSSKCSYKLSLRFELLDISMSCIRSVSQHKYGS